MLLWQVHIKYNAKPKDNHLLQLFQFETKSFKIPELKTNPVIEAYDQLELLGFPLCGYFNPTWLINIKNKIFSTNFC